MRRVLTLLVVAVALLITACGSGTPGDQATTEAVQTATATAATTESVEACSFAQSVPVVFASVLQVVTEFGNGTAFYIGGNEFLTAAHVVGGATEIQLRSSNHNLEAEVVGAEVDTDIAILSADGTGIEPLRFGDVADLGPGQPIAVAGFPRFVLDDPAVTSGLLSKVLEDPDFGFGTFLQTDAAVNPGNSGGPVFDECGAIVGMVVSKAISTDIEGIGWAVASNTLQTALPRVRRKGPEATVSEDQVVVEIDPVSRYVANTDGTGLSLRDDCLDDARIEGTWTDGTLVIVSFSGIGECAGWSVADDGTSVSWVHNSYLTNSDPSVAARPQPTATAVVTAAPTSQPTATATPVPTATNPPATPQFAIDVLDVIHSNALDLAGRITEIVGWTNSESLDYPTAAARMYELEDIGYSHSDLVLSAETDLSEFGSSCDNARKWYGDAVFYFALSAGYYGLAFEYWPDYPLNEAGSATAQAYDSLEQGSDYHYLCAIGE